MNVLVITPDYPDRFKDHYTFVKQLVDEFARQGHNCYVIAPYSISNNKRLYKKKELDGQVMVYRPNYLSFSNLNIWGFRPSAFFRQIAINTALKWLPVKPDVVYCHFWVSAIEAYPFAKKYNIPVIVASGESSITPFFEGQAFPEEIKSVVRGAICVSSKNKNESILLGLTTEDECLVKPNAVNSALFRKLNKLTCRKELGFPEDAFIICFVGAFVERKGANRVSSAIMSLTGEPVYSIFIGQGSVAPECSNILFNGPLRHETIPMYLNASDAFVLPTLREGCCNAIVEAMSCGLPIISSNLPFNWDVLDDSNAILIDPNDIGSIAEAIRRLRDDKQLRLRMAEASLEKSKSLTIDQRAKGIMDFISSRITI